MRPLEDLCAIACQSAWAAADILRAYYRGDQLEIDRSGEGPVTAADLAANQSILSHLKGELGQADFGYLSEETYQAEGIPTDRDWIWIIDPLDGTKDFIQKTGEYAIHLALVYQGRPEVAIVACPEAEVIYAAVRGSGTVAYHRDGSQRSPRVSDCDRLADLTVVVSRSHRDDRFDRLLAALPCQNQHAVGSVGGKIAAIVEQRADLYLSLSGKSAPKDWDMAAPELVLTEAGGQFTHFDGQPLRYAQGDPSQWGGRIASNGPQHDVLCKLLQTELEQLP
jgi:3'(2'), 5'-bisphosphate nucleotidase